MTDQSAAVYRPGPRPGPAGAPSRPAPERPLHVVPDSAEPNSEVPTSGNEPGVAPETISAGQSGSPAEIGQVTSGSRFRLRVAAARLYWTPPSIFTDRPASLEELNAYAKRAPWTHQQTGIIRGFGVGWYRFVAYPYTVISRYREHFVQRPLRFAAAVGGIKLLALTGPGHWVVHTVVYPVAQFAGHVFL